MRKLNVLELDRPDLETFRQLPKAPITLVLDNIRSGLNVGSAFRTADAFALEQIVLCGITAQPPHREILKTAIGATASVSWKYRESTLEAVRELQGEGYEVIAVEQTDESIPLQQFEVGAGQKYALVFGNEVEGVQDTVIRELQKAIEIPQQGTKHSLNISVCLGIVSWYFWSERLPK